MVLFNLQMTQPINLQCIAGTFFQWRLQLHSMQVLLVWRVLNVNNAANQITEVVDNVPRVGNLATHLGIKWRDVKNNLDILVAWQCLFNVLTSLSQTDYLGILNFQIGIANILAWLLEFSPNVRLNAHPVVNITSFAGPILLLGHGSFKTSFINAKTFISRIFLGQFNWEAIGIIQLKGRLAIDLIAAICLGLFNHVV